MKTVDCTIASTSAEVDLVAASIRELCAGLGFSEIETYECELAAEEAMMNVVRHAYHNEHNESMTVTAAAEGGQLIVQICDTGTSMPADRARDLTQGVDGAESAPQVREALKEGGRGLQIIHDVMDEVSYLTDNGVNRLRMVKRIPSNSDIEQSS